MSEKEKTLIEIIEKTIESLKILTEVVKENEKRIAKLEKEKMK